MIKLLGPRRLFILLLLVGVNAFLAFVVYTQLTPKSMTLSNQLRTAKNKASSTQNDIERIQIEFSKLEQQQEDFDELERDGFLSSQGRRNAERLFELVQKESRVVSAVANVRAAVVHDNDIAAKAKHVVLQSPIDIQIKAIDDIDVYRYVSMLFERFKGHITIDELIMRRETEVSNPVLRGIAAGEDLPLITANLQMTWRTMIPEEDAAAIMGDQNKGRKNR